MKEGNWFPPYRYILASRSPRRIELLSAVNLSFTLEPVDISEEYPHGLGMTEIPSFLAIQKARCFEGRLEQNDLVIAADTIVSVNNEILGKPTRREEAHSMLRKLSGRGHEVVTGVCLKSVLKEKVFHVVTRVFFKDLSNEEIDYYLDHYRPYDKAGAYGIQEWIGMTGITRIEGSYFNVVGLPVQELYSEILSF